MKVVENCWDKVHAFDCQYGGHLFDGKTAAVYVNHWLAVSRDLWPYFSRKNEEGFVGHCVLVFHGVKRFNAEVTTYCNEDGNIVWHKPIHFSYSGSVTGTTNEYVFEGTLQGFPSSMNVKVEAEKFELHILEKDEPAKEG